MMNILHFPLVNSYTVGRRDGMISANFSRSFQEAYDIAVIDSLNHKSPNDYLRGFRDSFRSEEAKLMAS
jgi:hypothetical protein